MKEIIAKTALGLVMASAAAAILIAPSTGHASLADRDFAHRWTPVRRQVALPKFSIAARVPEPTADDLTVARPTLDRRRERRCFARHPDHRQIRACRGERLSCSAGASATWPCPTAVTVDARQLLRSSGACPSRTASPTRADAQHSGVQHRRGVSFVCHAHDPTWWSRISVAPRPTTPQIVSVRSRGQRERRPSAWIPLAYRRSASEGIPTLYGALPKPVLSRR